MSWIPASLRPPLLGERVLIRLPGIINETRVGRLEMLRAGIPDEPSSEPYGAIIPIWIGDDGCRFYLGTDPQGHEAVVSHWQPLAGAPLDKDPSILRNIQREARMWTDHNFPGTDANRKYLGVVEEVGEWAHARLKRMDGIRGTPEEHIAAEKDAMGDIIIFMLGYADYTGWDLHSILEHTWAHVRQRDFQEYPKTGFPPIVAEDDYGLPTGTRWYLLGDHWHWRHPGGNTPCGIGNPAFYKIEKSNITTKPDERVCPQCDAYRSGPSYNGDPCSECGLPVWHHPVQDKWYHVDPEAECPVADGKAPPADVAAYIEQRTPDDSKTYIVGGGAGSDVADSDYQTMIANGTHVTVSGDNSVGVGAGLTVAEANRILIDVTWVVDVEDSIASTDYPWVARTGYKGMLDAVGEDIIGRGRTSQAAVLDAHIRLLNAIARSLAQTEGALKVRR